MDRNYTAAVFKIIFHPNLEKPFQIQFVGNHESGRVDVGFISNTKDKEKLSDALFLLKTLHSTSNEVSRLLLDAQNQLPKSCNIKIVGEI